MSDSNREPLRYQWSAPIAAGTILFILALILWWALCQREFNNMQTQTRAEAINLLSYIELDLKNRIPAVERLARRWESNNGTSKKVFTRDAQLYIADIPGFQAIAWVNKKFKVTWVIPLVGNEKALGIYLGFEKKRLHALESAKAKKTPTITAPVDLVQGGTGLLIYSPIYKRTGFDGFILGVLRTDAWLEALFRTHENKIEKENFIATVLIDGKEVYKQTPKGWQTNNDFNAIEDLRYYNHKFSVSVKPTKTFVKSVSTYLPELTLFAGTLLSILVSGIIFLLQKTSRQTRRVLQAKNDLLNEVNERKYAQEALHEAKNSLTLATKAGQIGVWKWNISSGKLIWNSLMFQIYGISPSIPPTYETWANALHPDDKAKAEKQISDALQGITTFDAEFRIILLNGKHRHIHAAASIEKDDNGKPLYMTGINIDITDLKETQELLSHEKEKLNNIIEGTNVGTWEWNIQTGKTTFNERSINIIGYTTNEFTPESITEWEKNCHPDDFRKSEEILAKHFRGELDYFDFETRMRHKNGNWIWIHDRGKVSSWTEDGKPLLMFGTIQDITERKKAEEQIKHMANYDILTDLPIRKLAEDRLTMAIAAAERSDKLVAVLFVDLDGFKEVNDKYGHSAGDTLLVEIANRLKARLRKADTVARIGGDEFLIIVSEVPSKQSIEQIARQIVADIAMPVVLKEGVVTVGTSIGIAVFPDNGHDIKTLIKQADKAMYTTKKTGKNGYTFQPATETADDE